eukprot:scaffold20728_cov132-Isochrysis_galbana.AAC.6
MKNIIPVVMAGVLGIYGLIIAVIISNNIVAVVGTSVRGPPLQPIASARRRRSHSGLRTCISDQRPSLCSADPPLPRRLATPFIPASPTSVPACAVA